MSVAARRFCCFGGGAQETYIIGISEEPNTGNDHSTHVVPSEWGLVDLSKSQAAPLVWILQTSVSAFIYFSAQEPGL